MTPEQRQVTRRVWCPDSLVVGQPRCDCPPLPGIRGILRNLVVPVSPVPYAPTVGCSPPRCDSQWPLPDVGRQKFDLD